MPQRLPKEARDLISRHIHSVAQLEVLLYLRSRAGQGITADELARDQKIGTEMAAGVLDDLASRGFVKQSEGSFVYGPEPSLARQVDELGAAYSSYRVSVINLIFSRPDEGVQSFADAFRVRRDEE